MVELNWWQVGALVLLGWILCLMYHILKGDF